MINFNPRRLQEDFFCPQIQVFIISKTYRDTRHKLCWVLGVNTKVNYLSLWKKEAFCSCCTKGFVGIIFFFSILNTVSHSEFLYRTSSFKNSSVWKAMKSNWKAMMDGTLYKNLIDTEFTDKRQKLEHTLPCMLLLHSLCILFTSPSHPGGTADKMTFLRKQIYQTNKNFRMYIFSSVYYCTGHACKQNIEYFNHRFIVSWIVW